MVRPLGREPVRMGLTVLAVALGVAVVLAIDLAGTAATGSFRSSLETLAGNYTLEVTVTGEVDPRSGFVVDLKQLKHIMNREVLDALDHRFLNKEVPEFLTRIPTTENIAIAIWQRLSPKLKAAQLHRVRVYETPDLFVDFYGEA